MNRSEFLAQLKSALENKMSPSAVKENVDYYRNYIQEEVQNGKSEQEVIDMLGDPWAIAKTILMSSGMNSQEYSSDTADVQEKQEDNQKNANMHIFGTSSRWKMLAILLCVFAVLAIIFSIIFGIIKLIAPVLIPVLAVVFVVKLWKNK